MLRSAILIEIISYSCREDFIEITGTNLASRVDRLSFVNHCRFGKEDSHVSAESEGRIAADDR